MAPDVETLSELLAARADDELSVGDYVDLDGAMAEVVEINDGHVTRVRIWRTPARPEA